MFLLLIVGVGFVVFYEKYHTSKFSDMEIKIPLEILKKEWGEPDKIIQYNDGSQTIFYNTILNEFVFNVNDKKIVEFKYKDNF